MKDVLAGEACFYLRFENGVSSQYSEDFAYGGGDGPVVFTSFNAMPIEGMTQQEVEDQYGFLGFAKIPWFYNNDDQPQHNGVSVRIGGTGTTINTGPKEVFPGDLMRWRLPSIIKEERLEEDQRLPTIKGVSKKKMYPIWEPFDHREVTQLPLNALRLILEDDTGDETSLRALELDDEVADMPTEQEFALLLKHDTLASGLSFVLTLAQFGLINIELPNDDDPLSRTAYSSFNNVLRTSIHTLNKFDVVKGAGPNDSTVLRVDRSKPADKDRRQKEAQFLGHLFGLLHDSEQPHLRPAHSLVQALVARSNFGFLALPEDRKLFTIASALPGKSRKRVRDANEQVHYNNSTISGVMAKIEAESKINLLQAWKLASEDHDRHIGFQATSHAFTGETVDYNLN